VSDFDGLTAVITGGASGIGAATAALLHERGASVAILDRAVEGADPRFFSVSCDITDAAGVDRAIAEIAAKFGGIDILINNAGIGAAGDVTANDDAEWAHVFDVNVIGIARVSRAALPHLRASAAGAIVNTCSVAAIIGLPQRALYSASKGAVAALTLAMAADHLREGIRVNAVMPGTADTPWVARLLEASDDAAAASVALKARQPMGRLVTPGEIAHAIAYLASPAAASTTGTTLTVDGGLFGLRLG
jgi:NAD(P)-dependent dehydrogenase (short-subunit alcohol dehydrogenase family)